MFRLATGILLAVLAATNLAQAENPMAIKVLWCTGGGFHDYKGLQPILTKAIQKHSPLPIRFTASTDPSDWAKPGFADNYDLIVLFFTQHDPTGKSIVDNIAQDDRRRQAGRGDSWHAALLSRAEPRSRRLLRGPGVDFRQAR